jgi:hypothetical protein
MAQNRLSNNAGIDLATAVWLAHDDYDHDAAANRSNYISVTTLIKSPRQIILSGRVPVEDRITDLADLVASRMGQALHSDIERVWKHHYADSLRKLGYPEKAIKAIRINPEQQEPDTLPVYTEVRVERAVGNFVVGGKIDLIVEGRLHDFKKTSVWGYMAQRSVGDKWKLQGSLYRYLNPEKITHDQLSIQYLLSDWSRAFASRDPSYPQVAVPHRLIALMGVQETETWLLNKLRLLEQLADAPEEMLPLCGDDDLWRSAPTYKFYANAAAPTGSRSTKNFDNLQAAMLHKATKGTGRVDVVPGEVKACKYCPAFPVCSQKDALIASGLLNMDN